ncbi:unnamed protein product, partial [Amoebophrya sp. A25]
WKSTSDTRKEDFTKLLEDPLGQGLLSNAEPASLASTSSFLGPNPNSMFDTGGGPFSP